MQPNMPPRRATNYMTECVTIMREVFDKNVAAACLTDKDAFQKMNDELLPYGQKICYRTYQRYKAAALSFGEMAVEEQELFDPVFQDLYHAMQRAQIRQKENLYKTMMDADDSQWHKYKWIMERKFPDFNLRKVNEEYLRDSDMIERRILEMDLVEVGLTALPLPASSDPAKAVEQPTMEKPAEQVKYEAEFQADAEKHIPAHELEAFKLYWVDVKDEWDRKNLLNEGYKFDEVTRKKLVFHYQVHFMLWERDKQKWLKKMAA